MSHATFSSWSWVSRFSFLRLLIVLSKSALLRPGELARELLPRGGVLLRLSQNEDRYTASDDAIAIGRTVTLCYIATHLADLSCSTYLGDVDLEPLPLIGLSQLQEQMQGGVR